MMVRKEDQEYQPSSAFPAWRWPVQVLGSACFLIVMGFPYFMKGGSDAEACLFVGASGVSLLGSLAYYIGRYTFWAKYSRTELRFAFSPMILSAVIVVGVVLAIAIAAFLAR